MDAYDVWDQISVLAIEMRDTIEEPGMLHDIAFPSVKKKIIAWLRQIDKGDEEVIVLSPVQVSIEEIRREKDEEDARDILEEMRKGSKEDFGDDDGLSD